MQRDGRMRERFIPEEMVIQTLENGTMTEQTHGTYLYEHQINDEILEAIVIVRVVVDESNRKGRIARMQALKQQRTKESQDTL